MSLFTFRKNFNPHLPCGRRLYDALYGQTSVIFQSTPSLRKATPLWSPSNGFLLFQSTPSLRKATIKYGQKRRVTCISIHTFLAEGDRPHRSLPLPQSYFNPHLPCGRRRQWPPSQALNPLFQSTPSLRKATLWPLRCRLPFFHFNPHLPCGRRHSTVRLPALHILFQSTPSLRKATRRTMDAAVH